jgi:hypothetical protein
MANTTNLPTLDNSNGTVDNLTASIDDYLLALADGIHQAQLQLSQMRIPAQPGQPAVMYQLPRVDFELKMSFEVSHSQKRQGQSSNLALAARPVNQSQSKNSAAEAASVLKGSFVAVPVDGGKPPSLVSVNLQILNRQLEITVKVQLATGEARRGVPVQFNIDRDQSQSINQLEGLTEPELKPNTSLWSGGQIDTNKDGKAVNTLQVDPEETVGKHIVIIVDVASKTETLIFVVPSDISDLSTVDKTNNTNAATETDQ